MASPPRAIRSPLTQALLKLLADRQWRTRKEVMVAVCALLPPERGLKRYNAMIARRTRYKPRQWQKPISMGEQIRQGHWHIISNSIDHLIASGSIERRGTGRGAELRITPRCLDYAQRLGFEQRLPPVRIAPSESRTKHWNVAMARFLMDGEWHEVATVRAVGMRLIPPAMAVRKRDGNCQRITRKRAAQRKTTDAYTVKPVSVVDKVRTGAGMIAHTGIMTLVKDGHAEIRLGVTLHGEERQWMRITEKGRARYGSVAQPAERRSPKAEAGGSSPPGPALTVVQPNRGGERRPRRSGVPPEMQAIYRAMVRPEDDHD